MWLCVLEGFRWWRSWSRWRHRSGVGRRQVVDVANAMEGKMTPGTAVGRDVPRILPRRTDNPESAGAWESGEAPPVVPCRPVNPLQLLSGPRSRCSRPVLLQPRGSGDRKSSSSGAGVVVFWFWSQGDHGSPGKGFFPSVD
ncbi:uncharacterized protein LOC143033778 [Oratosquilla oratoria]|uniref:uncharacterized protein LOC143033778 n=1 Tax=Oratosquilla oratoria TaxID=337810 RepID=UPI003F76862B